jgi:aspartyl/glutamyl-tRNA(Asn/Gln) amidotransferase C subunit
LAHLEILSDQRTQIKNNIGEIIEMLDQLADVDTSDIEALAHPIPGHIMTLGGETPDQIETDPAAILHNVRHRMINNAVKIQSMLSEE